MQSKKTERKIRRFRKFSLLRWLIPSLLILIILGTTIAHVPNFKFLGSTFTKPKPITQSNTALPLNVQQAIEDLAKQEIKQEHINLNQDSLRVQKETLAEKQHLYEVLQEIVQAIFITDKKTDFEKKLPSDIQKQIARLKKTLPEKNIPKLTVPQGVNLPKVAKLSPSIEQAIIHAARQRIKNKQRPEEVKLDLTVHAKDLGIGEPSILPDNPLYPIKKLFRALQLALTSDPLQKVQLLITQDNEKTLEAAKLLEKSSSRKTIELALSVLAEVEKDFNKLKESSGKLDKLKTEGPEQNRRIDRIVNQIIRNGLARQTVFSSIEDRVYGKDFVRVEKIRQSVLKDGVDSLLALTGGDARALVLKLEQAVNEQSGSKFKELKAIELLTEIKRFQPAKIGALLKESEIRLIKQFETHLLAIEKKEREQELLAYAKSLPGNPVRQFETYEELKKGFTNKETIRLAEALENKAIENLRDQISEITDGQTLQEFAKETVGNKPEDLAVIIAAETNAAAPIEQKVEEIKLEVEQNIVSDLSKSNTTIASTESINKLEEQILKEQAIVQSSVGTVAETPQTATQEQTLLQQTVQQVENEVFSGTESGQEIVQTLPQTAQEEIVQVQQEVPVEQVPIVETTTESPSTSATPAPIPAVEQPVESPLPAL